MHLETHSRQIVDWYMFLKAFPEEKSHEEQLSEELRFAKLDKLAAAVTGICNTYLGLGRTFPSFGKADEEIVMQLAEHILECGNFGHARDHGDATTKLVLRNRNPVELYRILQNHGLATWKAAKKYPFLRPFAGIYQIGHYTRSGLFREDAFGRLNKAVKDSRRQNDLFDALGIRQERKGFSRE